MKYTGTNNYGSIIFHLQYVYDWRVIISKNTSDVWDNGFANLFGGIRTIACKTYPV